MALSNTKTFVESCIKSYEERIREANKKEGYKTRFQNDAGMVFEATARRENTINRYRSFVESVKTSLVTECLYNLFEKCVNPSSSDTEQSSIMRSIVSQYVLENGYDDILYRMKSGSVALSEMNNIITNATEKILESVDKNDPNTFTVTSDMKDDFFKSLNYSDSDAISDAIKSRTTAAMDEFIKANAKDHEDIASALKDAQDKIDTDPRKDDESFKEACDYNAKRKIAKIRTAPKGLFHCMVSSMCESVLKNQEAYAEFVTEGKLNVDKIVNRMSLMYTFMEMLNTTRLEKIDEAFVGDVINGLKG